MSKPKMWVDHALSLDTDGPSEDLVAEARAADRDFNDIQT
jgi:hypothetical protein